jgi:hypothetical protein
MRLSRLFTATAALVVLAATPAMAHDGRAAATDAKLQAQIEANDLSPRQARYLQARVDRVIARTGGTQVAINQVVWDGGDTLVPLPGERRARELGTSARAASERSPHGLRGPDNCHYLQFCTYYHRNYTGIESRMVSCVLHEDRAGIFGSYINNQTRGTRARFYDSGVELIATTQPALFWNTVDPFLASATFYIRPC